jgi:hypothetical protein
MSMPKDAVMVGHASWTRKDLADPGEHHPFTVTDSRPDYAQSIGSEVIRGVHEGRRAVVVPGTGTSRSSYTKPQIDALVDLLHLYRCTAPPDGVTVADELDIILGVARPEASDALFTLVRSLKGAPDVRIFDYRRDGAITRLADTRFDPATEQRPLGWERLLSEVLQRELPPLVRDVMDKVGRAELRAYPMLSQPGRWSIRLEGLEVARLDAAGGFIDIGKAGKDNAVSPARRVWLEACEPGATRDVRADDPGAIATAARQITRFAAAWLNPGGNQQNEHALESRILRGHTPIDVPGVGVLDLIPPPACDLEGYVNWGSQFPTLWGTGGPARYLDALLHKERTPWAIEMKVDIDGRGTGIGGYYRHAISQAVLYREFIRAATPLHFWFQDQDLDANDCRAAVVVPDLTAESARRDHRADLQAICKLFDVALIEVDRQHAVLR